MNSPSRILLGAMIVVLIGVAASAGYLTGRSLPSSTRTTTATLTTTTGTTYFSTRTTTPTFPVQCSGLQSARVRDVLFMNLTSTACMVVTYRGLHVGIEQLGVSILRWSCYSNSTGSGCPSPKNYTGSFMTASAPSSVNLTEIPAGSTFSVMYLVRPLGNATGFYDLYFPTTICGNGVFPFAVGYSPSQINASDFLGIVPGVPPHCFVPPLYVVSVSVANMGYESLPID
ncbi:MAG: hypothetical protein ABSB29_02645 [Nitrososphaerales archaeon]|jgi:hypothetical protein